jgi:proteic killer suppression protein
MTENVRISMELLEKFPICERKSCEKVKQLKLIIAGDPGVANYNVMRYSCIVLQSFGDKMTEQVWRREVVRSFDRELLRSALRKLLILDAAEELNDLTIPPGNRLEKLRGDRAGQYSIRINQQWRICFRWTEAGPEDVSIVDYH